jgi:outer membrane protein assembly factor BamE (lipoprotein component of BamABCDE complex)
VFGARARRLLLTVAFSAVLAGCAAQTAQHGQIFTEAEVQQVQEGMTQDQVMLTLGSPTTRSTVGDGAFYYISTRTKTPVGFMKPRVVDRRVVAVYFDESNQVRRVANYGLEDGKVIDFITRETPTYSGEDGILKELFRNVGTGVKPQIGQDD